MTTDPTTERLSVLEKVGYGLGDTACKIGFQRGMSLMAYCYTDVFGLRAAAIVTLFHVPRALVSLAVPVMGAICDRTTTRWGKVRAYLLWLCIPYAAAGILAFTTL